MSLVLRAANGDSQPLDAPTFADAMDAVGALGFRGSPCFSGCYVLEGDEADVGELLADEAMAYVVDRKYGEQTRSDVWSCWASGSSLGCTQS